MKEVAGTKVYEQRRTESLRIMAETDAKRGKIDDLLEYIDTRLAELEEEKEEGEGNDDAASQAHEVKNTATSSPTEA